MSDSPILTRFIHDGPSGITEVPFRIEADGATYRDWVIRENTQKTRVPGTNITYVEHLGFEPAVVTWKLYFACGDDFNALVSLLEQEGTLVVLANMQSLLGSTPQAWQLGRAYEYLDRTWIAGIDESRHRIGGSVEAQVTFERAVDPVTRKAVI